MTKSRDKQAQDQLPVMKQNRKTRNSKTGSSSFIIYLASQLSLLQMILFKKQMRREGNSTYKDNFLKMEKWLIFPGRGD